MLFLLSPAKSLDYDTPVPEGLTPSQPVFQKDAATLIKTLREKSTTEISQLMDLSDNLSHLNAARYLAWRPKATPKNAKPALLAFNGDVYEGLDAKSLEIPAIEWAQSRLVMLSGLYGVLRPLDLLQPYRLEMGTALINPNGKNLYQFWGSRIADQLNQFQTKERQPVVVNLASQEYFKAVDRAHLKATVVECVFQEFKSDTYKIISFMAKRARGLMARFVIDNRIESIEQLKSFDLEGYSFSASASTTTRFVFRRNSPS